VFELTNNVCLLIGIILVALLVKSCSFPLFLVDASDTPTPSSSNIDFSIMQITDTQHLTWEYPSLFNATTQWIVSNANTYNLKMAVHTGDIVDIYNYVPMWNNANASMSILKSAGIPYCWNAGNHDQMNITGRGNPDDGWYGGGYSAFNSNRFLSYSYWVDSIFDSKNMAVKFLVDSYSFLVLNLEFEANSSVLAWATNLITANNQTNVIVATHAYLTETGAYGSDGITSGVWEQSFYSWLNQFPNVFLTLNGHAGGIDLNNDAWHQQASSGREEIFYNRQNVNNNEGAASVRIYSFSFANNNCSVSTYCLDTSSWLSDSGNDFFFSPHLILSNPSPTSTPEPKNSSTSILPSEVSYGTVVVAIAVVTIAVTTLIIKKQSKHTTNIILQQPLLINYKSFFQF
jgi:Calcineurin-like phosphoesterase